MKQKPTNAPIENEAANGLKTTSTRSPWLVRRIRTLQRLSSSSTWPTMTSSTTLLPTPQGWGYAVFGKVVPDRMWSTRSPKVRTGMVSFYGDVPVEDVVIEKAEII